MARIGFIHNWNNKLNCNVFTTIRKLTESKLSYYQSEQYKMFDVVLNNKFHSQARLIFVDVKQYKSIPASTLLVDTGQKHLMEADKIFKKFGIRDEDGVLILTFAKD